MKPGAVTMYKDGDTITVQSNKVERFETNGWSTEKPVREKSAHKKRPTKRKED